MTRLQHHWKVVLASFFPLACRQPVALHRPDLPVYQDAPIAFVGGSPKLTDEYGLAE